MKGNTQQNFPGILDIAIDEGFFALDHEWNFIAADAAITKVAKKTKERLLGNNFWKIFPELIGSDLQLHFKKAAQTGKKICFDYKDIYSRKKFYRINIFPNSAGLFIWYEDISTRKKKESETASSERILAALFNATTDSSMIVDRRFKLLAINRAARENFIKLCNRAPKLGDNLNDFQLPPVIKEYFKKALRGERTMVERDSLYPDDSIKWWYEKYLPSYNYEGELVSVVINATDITERKKAEQVLQKNEELYFSTLKSISDAVIAINMDFKITYLNPSAESLTGFSFDEAINQTFNDFIQVSDGTSGKEISNALQCPLDSRTNRIAGDLLLKTKQGKEVPIGEGSIGPIINSKGQFAGMVIIFKNISEKIEIERLEKEMETERIAAIIEGQESERSRIARELHDGLGQMLNLIKMKFDILMEGQSSEIGSLVDETIQESSKISENLVPSKLRDFDLSTAINSLCNQLTGTSRATISFYSFGNRSYIDENKKINIYRIVQEALNNALKHSNASTISVALNEEVDTIELCIEDNGAGITDKKTNSFHHGMQNMRERVQIMGGKFYLESEKNKGTLIIVEVPRQMSVD